MNRILRVAWRDFLATTATKGFILGAFVVPALMIAILVFVFPLLLDNEAPPVEGTLAVIDRSGEVAGDVAAGLQPERLAARREGDRRAVREKIAEMGVPATDEAVDQALDRAQAGVPQIRVQTLDAGADPDAEKAELRSEKAERLGLVLVEADAVRRAAEDADWGGFQLWVRKNLDDRVQDEIRDVVRDVIRDRRVRASGLEPALVERLTRVSSPAVREVTEEGERRSLGEMRQFVSFGFMAVLLISVLVGGQALLTTTVEEKSSRVVEVLLSALSPMELMTGKILGQMAVALTMLAIYTSIGGGALVLLGLADLLGPLNLLAMIVFFLIAYMTIGALMAAVGSAVNELREAQSLQAPIMLSLAIPYLLWLPISRNPESTFAFVCSLLPPINSFVMILRITSTEPPPWWQVALSILIGLAGVWASLWFAAKVFRVGLLMFGKPPNLATLVRWIRLA